MYARRIVVGRIHHGISHLFLPSPLASRRPPSPSPSLALNYVATKKGIPAPLLAIVARPSLGPTHSKGLAYSQRNNCHPHFGIQLLLAKELIYLPKP